jgi:hypothetical protein
MRAGETNGVQEGLTMDREMPSDVPGLLQEVCEGLADALCVMHVLIDNPNRLPKFQPFLWSNFQRALAALTKLEDLRYQRQAS